MRHRQAWWMLLSRAVPGCRKEAVAVTGRFSSYFCSGCERLPPAWQVPRRRQAAGMGEMSDRGTTRVWHAAAQQKGARA